MPTNWSAITPVFREHNHMKGQPKKDNTIAYCHNFIHHGALSETMVRQHECIQKNCRFFQKNLEHPYWNKKRIQSEAKKRDKLLKWYEDKRGTGVKKVTGNLLKVSSSSINTDLGSMLQFFENFEVYHIYIFFRDGAMKMKYLGGFYGFDVAMDKAGDYVYKGNAEFVLIADESCSVFGYRVLERNRNLAEVDLSWGVLYKALRKIVEDDVLLRLSYKEEAM